MKSSGKNNKNQEVRSFGIISLLLLVGTCVLIGAPAWNGSLAEQQERSLRRAESLAYQLLETRQPGSRTPASAAEQALNHLSLDQGHIGQDPWGQPYHYKLLKAQEFHKTRVVVWSAGPNRILETAESVFDPNRDIESPKFDGDDLGIIVSVK